MLPVYRKSTKEWSDEEGQGTRCGAVLRPEDDTLLHQPLGKPGLVPREDPAAVHMGGTLNACGVGSLCT